MYLFLFSSLQSLLILLYERRINSLIFGSFFLIVWVFIFSFRGGEYGLDILTYYKFFLQPNKCSVDEPFLCGLNVFLNFFSDSIVWFSFSYALILNALLLLMYRLASKSNWVLYFLLLSTTFIFFQLNLNIYRQGLAFVVAISIIYLSFKKTHWFALFLVVPLLIHKASLLFFIVYILCFFKLRASYIVTVLLLAVLPFSQWAYDLVLNNLVSYFPVFSYSVGEYRRLAEAGLITASEIDHRNLPVIFCCLILLYKNFKQDRVTSWIIVSLLGMASLLKMNVLLYDRVILGAQLLSVVVLINFALFKFKYNYRLLSLSMLVFSIFTIFIWGPRNFLGEFEFVFG